MIHLRLLGPVDVGCDGGPAPPELLWRKHLALLVYLACSDRNERARDHLINLLWADKPEDAARHSLNEAIRILRRHAGCDVDRQHQRVRLAEGAVTLDTAEFERAAAAGDLTRAAQLVAGEFMEGFSVADAWEFEEWLAHERSEWRRRCVAALRRHGRELLARGDAHAALGIADRALALDPADEETARLKLSGCAILGDRAGALRFYEDFVALLDDRLGVAPEPQTASLVERIRGERAWLHGPTSALAPEARRPPLTGLDAELGSLVSLWQTCAGERRSAVAIVEGEAGTGKTRLLEEVAVRARLDGGRVINLRAVEADRARPGAVLAALLRATAGPDRSRPGELLSAEVRALAAAEPLVICFDDAHWIDDESIRELIAVLRDLAHQPVLVIAAVTPRDGATAIDELRAQVGRSISGLTVKTRALNGDELRGLARWALPQYDEVQLERVARRVSADSAGIPFLAVELLSAVAHGLDVTGASAAWPQPSQTFEQTLPGDLPDAVVAAIRVGFRKLGRDAQSVAAAAAVLEAPIAQEALGLALDLPPARLAQALDELEWQRWLVADERGYSYVARVARAVVARDMVTSGQRQRLAAAARAAPTPATTPLPPAT